jgi:hypothetical protein
MKCTTNVLGRVSAPLSNSSRTQSMCPLEAASISAVIPYCDLAKFSHSPPPITIRMHCPQQAYSHSTQYGAKSMKKNVKMRICNHVHSEAKDRATHAASSILLGPAMQQQSDTAGATIRGGEAQCASCPRLNRPWGGECRLGSFSSSARPQLALLLGVP